MQKDKIENPKKELESQTKLINIKLNDMQNAFGGISDNLNHLQNTEGALHTQEFTFDDGETEVVVNAPVILRYKEKYNKLASQKENFKKF